MSDFAYFRFVRAELLTENEIRDKDEMTSATEEVLHAKGLECDTWAAKATEEEIKKLLEQVRRLRLPRKKKRRLIGETVGSIEGLKEQNDQSEQHNEKEVVYAGGK